MKSDQINELAAALAKAQSKLEGADKNSDNPFYKSRYADLSAVWEVIRKPFADNGLSVSQLVSTVDAKPILKTVLMHSSGQFLVSDMPIVVEKPGPQAMGSAISYARRYSLAAIAGVYQTDDDAEGAHGRQSVVQLVTKPPTPTINPLAPRVIIPKGNDDVPEWTSPPSGMFDSLTKSIEQVPLPKPTDDLKKIVADAAEKANWTTKQVGDEIKKRDFKKFEDMSPNAIQEMLLFIKGNPKK